MTDVEFDPARFTEARARTYHAFMLGVKWFAIHLAAILSFLVLTFCTSAGWGWGLCAAIVVVAAGAWAMTHGLNHSSVGG